ncbi:ROK family transcriptional regulator [Amycolatopsis sp. cg13]|uniref:ROK family transcriptional regulator n=1 Tax=Amycolatopsis sp. cg13 TaxID=3238807 RepID=UPI003526BC07
MPTPSSRPAPRGGSLRGLREANRERVLRILQAGPRPQARIAEEAGLSPATVTAIVRELVESGQATVEPGTSSGRRATIVSLATQPPGTLVGISLRRDGIDVATWGKSGARLESAGWDGLPDPGRTNRERVARFVADALPDGEQAIEATVAMPAAVPLAKRRTIVLPPEYPLADWVGDDALAPLEQVLGTPAAAKNDANLAALAELRIGAAQGVSNALYLELSEGVGGAFILDDEVFEGDGGMAGELGHLQGSEHGPRCWCGNRGCLELLVGADALLPGLRALHPGEPMTLRTLADDVADGRELARRIAVEAGRDAGYGVAPLVQALNLSTVVVGGQLAACGDPLLSSFTETLSHFSALVGPRVETRLASLGPRAVALGAVVDAATRCGLYSFSELKNV